MSFDEKTSVDDLVKKVKEEYEKGLKEGKWLEYPPRQDELDLDDAQAIGYEKGLKKGKELQKQWSFSEFVEIVRIVLTEEFYYSNILAMEIVKAIKKQFGEEAK